MEVWDMVWCAFLEAYTGAATCNTAQLTEECAAHAGALVTSPSSSGFTIPTNVSKQDLVGMGVEVPQADVSEELRTPTRSISSNSDGRAAGALSEGGPFAAAARGEPYLSEGSISGSGSARSSSERVPPSAPSMQARPLHSPPLQERAHDYPPQTY